YPYLDQYLRNTFPHVLNKPRVMWAFWKWSDFNFFQWGLGGARFYFIYGQGPTILVSSDTSHFGCHYVGQDPGDLKKRAPGPRHAQGIMWANTIDAEYIILFDGLAATMDRAYMRIASNQRHDGDDLIAEMMEATITHEM